MALPLFSATLFVSAFILFLVQPIIGKLILPMLGGTPQVWNTCMVFFQTALLAGYAYTHTSTSRFPLHRQLLVHAILLFVPFLVLMPPLGPFDFHKWQGTIPLGGNPIPWALGLLTLLVGLPFFVVATSSPLLQRWFVHTGHEAARDPYFLSIASNVGSLLALLAYPAFIEPYLTLEQQKWSWTVMYGILGVLVLVAASAVWKAPPLKEVLPEPSPEPGIPNPPTPPPPPQPQPQPAKQAQTGISRKKFGKGGGGGGKPSVAVTAHAPAPPRPIPDLVLRSRPITPWRRLRWVLLGAAPSSLMLGVVTYICTDLSPIPLLWIIPLAMYLLSFILVFAKWPVVWTDGPHKVVLFLQPVLVLGLILMLSQGFASGPVLHTSIALLAFFATALVCHGEMAKDRPDTRHLTEFYLWMSVGGMVGGMFNGLVAPLLFWGVAEFPLAIVLGCLLRPSLKEGGWTETGIENYFPGVVGWFRTKGNELAAAYQRPEPNSTYAMSYSLDILLPLLLGVLAFGLMQISSSNNWPYEHESNSLYKFYRSMQFSSTTAISLALWTNRILVVFLPMVICFLFYNRPIRVGLGIGALLLVQAIYQREERTEAIYANRSYFGVLRVREDPRGTLGPYRYLMHGSTHHGLNYQDEKYRRLATTYYHQYGPAGIVMKKFNWFEDGFRKVKSKDDKYEYDPNTFLADMIKYTSDARIGASLVGAGAFGTMFPVDTVAAAWSEPPFATIGLGTGTMASYGRPFQHVHFYEIDRQIRRLSLPENESQMYKGGPYFSYLHDAIDRGSVLQVRMGDARLRMAYPYEPYNEELERQGKSKAGGPQNFYHMMVVDAFSSDAIPIHLITLEAIKMYMDKLVPDGILCIHTSNRHVDLVPVVQRVVEAIRSEPDSKMPRLTCRRAHDSAPGADRDGLGFAPGEFTSEWVMVARTPEILNELQAPPLYQESCERNLRRRLKNFGVSEERIDARIQAARSSGDFDYWTDPRGVTDSEYPNLRAWTDDYSNVLSVFRWR